MTASRIFQPLRRRGDGVSVLIEADEQAVVVQPLRQRMGMAAAAEVEFDRQGRILIPGTLREYAQLKKDVTILGTGDKIEIWAQEAYEEYAAKIVPDMEEIAESLDESLDIEF